MNDIISTDLGALEDMPSTMLRNLVNHHRVEYLHNMHMAQEFARSAERNSVISSEADQVLTTRKTVRKREKAAALEEKAFANDVAEDLSTLAVASASTSRPVLHIDTDTEMLPAGPHSA
jgi:hypothetical protein